MKVFQYPKDKGMHSVFSPNGTETVVEKSTDKLQVTVNFLASLKPDLKLIHQPVVRETATNL